MILKNHIKVHVHEKERMSPSSKKGRRLVDISSWKSGMPDRFKRLEKIGSELFSLACLCSRIAISMQL